MSISKYTTTESVDSFTPGLTTTLLSFAIVFCALYSSVLIALVPAGGVSASEREETARDDTLGLVESEKPDKKESEIGAPPLPTRLVAPSIKLDTTIVNPRSRDLAVLDSALLEGVVYYPGSGYVGENANMLFFGHSSFLPVVRNENFRAFNRIKELEIGDIIEVYSEGVKYSYEVTSNRLAKDSEVRVNFGAEAPMITLATCNSFGAKEDRYVIEAVLVSS